MGENNGWENWVRYAKGRCGMKTKMVHNPIPEHMKNRHLPKPPPPPKKAKPIIIKPSQPSPNLIKMKNNQINPYILALSFPLLLLSLSLYKFIFAELPDNLVVYGDLISAFYFLIWGIFIFLSTIVVAGIAVISNWGE